MCTACLAAGMSRRLVLGAGAAALAVAPLVGTAEAQPARAVDTPDAALTRLLEGNARFVVRVAGNFMTPDGLGSLEFGAAVLGTKVIMVLGHTSCGAVNATVAALQKGNDLPGHIGDLVRAMKPGIEPVLKQPGDDLYQRAVVANVRSNVQRLQEAKPILADMVAAGKLRVVGAVYDLPTGKVALV